MSDKYAAGDIKVIRTDRRRYALYNEFIGLHSFNPKPADEDVMVIIDGDDWLYDDGVLAYVSSIYDNNPNVWITYGTHYDFRWGVIGDTAKPLKPNHDFRRGEWVFAPLRTFKYFLFKNINETDLRNTRTGEFYTSEADLAMMIPLAEMAGQEHIYYISKPLYTYNSGNPESNHFINNGKPQCEADIRSRQPLQKMTKEQLLKGQRKWQ